MGADSMPELICEFSGNREEKIERFIQNNTQHTSNTLDRTSNISIIRRIDT